MIFTDLLYKFIPFWEMSGANQKKCFMNDAKDIIKRELFSSFIVGVKIYYLVGNIIIKDFFYFKKTFSIFTLTYLPCSGA